MQALEVLIVGGGIGGLTAAIALTGHGHAVTVIERDPEWSVYGVGIIQQGNVLRAMKQLGLLDDYLSSAVGFDFIAVHAHDDGRGVSVEFSDGSAGRYDIVVGADGVHSQTRRQLFPGSPEPQFTGQSVWRYNLPRPADLDALHVYNGPVGAGLVPMSDTTMYLYLTTPEPGNPRHPRAGLAATMRGKVPASLAELAERITDDAEVVYRPLETVMVEGPWHAGRVVLMGDAVHTTTPHLGQGAGMAVEDAIVLAEEIERHDTPEAAFTAYRGRRFERCRYIVEESLAICRGQLGLGPPVDNAKATAAMFEVTARPI